MKLFKLLSFVILLNGFAVAQTITNFEIKDVSPADCPIRVSGEIQLTEMVEDGVLKTSYKDRLLTTNPTTKAIVAMVVVNELITSYGPLSEDTKIWDAFFYHDLEVAPGQKYVHDHSTFNGIFESSLSPETKRGTPHAESRVIFVQFANRSTWGDVNDSRVQSLMRRRQAMLQTISRLDAAASQSEAEFVKALTASSDNQDFDKTVLHRIRERQNNSGNAVAIAKVREMLAVAASR